MTRTSEREASTDRWSKQLPPATDRPRPRRSLRYVFLLLGVVFLVGLVVQALVQVHGERQVLTEFGSAMADSLSISVTTPLWNLSRTNLEDLLASLSAFPSIEVALVSNESVPWLRYDRTMGVTHVPTGFTMSEALDVAGRPHVYEVHQRTIRFREREIGHLHVVLNDLPVEEAVHRSVRWSAVVYVGLAASLLLGLRSWESRIREDYLSEENVRLQQEVTRRRSVEDKLRRVAYYDPVTLLPRPEALGIEVPLPTETPGITGSRERVRYLLVVSIENLPELSAILDTVVVDDLLRAFGGRIQSALTDSSSVALRGTGFRFYAVFLQPDDFGAERTAMRLVEHFRRPVELGSREVRMRIRVGLAAFPDNQPFEEIRKRAETALASLRGGGSLNRVALYDEERRETTNRRVILENGMGRETFLSELVVHYQPIVEIRSRNVVGYEALVRWNHPELGLVSPVEFIPLAEEDGRIFDIGWKVILDSLDMIERLGRLRPQDPPFVAVNLSPVQLLEHGLPARIVDLLSSRGIPFQRIKLEITETAIDHHETTFLRSARALYEMGLPVAIDDFGAGSSALRRLHDNRFDTLKIDQHFIRHSDLGKRAALVVEGVARLAAGMGMLVVAEGIETDAEASFAAAAGCGLGQGYLFGRPAPPDVLLSGVERG